MVEPEGTHEIRDERRLVWRLSESLLWIWMFPILIITFYREVLVEADTQFY